MCKWECDRQTSSHVLKHSNRIVETQDPLFFYDLATRIYSTVLLFTGLNIWCATNFFFCLNEFFFFFFYQSEKRQRKQNCSSLRVRLKSVYVTIVVSWMEPKLLMKMFTLDSTGMPEKHNHSATNQMCSGNKGMFLPDLNHLWRWDYELERMTFAWTVTLKCLEGQQGTLTFNGSAGPFPPCYTSTLGAETTNKTSKTDKTMRAANYSKDTKGSTKHILSLISLACFVFFL